MERDTHGRTQTHRHTAVPTQRELRRASEAVAETKADTRDGHMHGQERLAKRRNARTFLDKFIHVSCQGGVS